MQEIPTPLVAIQGQPNLEEANRSVANLYRSIISNEGVVKKGLREVGFDSEELVANLDIFLYNSALTGSGQSEVDVQIRTINQFRGLLVPFLPKKPDAGDDRVTRAKPKPGKDSRGRKWEEEGWNQKD